jgi:hypothetical protein
MPNPVARWTCGQLFVFWCGIGLAMIAALGVSHVAGVFYRPLPPGGARLAGNLVAVAATAFGLLVVPAFGLWKTWRRIGPRS